MRNVVGSNLDGLQDTSEQLPKHVIPHRVDGNVHKVAAYSMDVTRNLKLESILIFIFLDV